MPRNVFFSFYYEEDIIRVSQVRNSSVFQKGEVEPFLDKVEWEAIKQDDAKIINWIEKQMSGTSVLVVLIGANTYNRKWVRYEIIKAHRENRGIVGIHIHQIKNFQSETSTKGINPLSQIYDDIDGKEVCFDELYDTYDWIDDDGRENMRTWIEQAAVDVGR